MPDDGPDESLESREEALKTLLSSTGLRRDAVASLDPSMIDVDGSG